MKPRTEPFTIYHWDTFDNETFEKGTAKTLAEAREFVRKAYGSRIRPDGADQVDIVDLDGNLVEKIKVG